MPNKPKTLSSLISGVFLSLLLSGCVPKNSKDQRINLKNQEAITIKSSDSLSVIVASTDGVISVVVLKDGKPSFTLESDNGIETATQNLYFENREEIITLEGKRLRPTQRMVIDQDPSGESKSGYVEAFVGGEFERSQPK